MDNFKDIVFYDNEKEKIISYRSGLTVYEEEFKDGIFASAGRNAAGFMLNVLDDMPTRFNLNCFTKPEAFDFLADGYSLTGTWKFVSFEKENITNENGTEILRATIILESELKPVRIKLITNLDGTEVIERSYIIENTGDAPLAISDITVMGGGLETLNNWNQYGKAADYNEIYELIYPEYCCWGHEGLLRSHPLKSGGTYFAGRYMCDRHRHPMFMLRNRYTGALVNCQLAFTGGYRFEFYLDATNDNAFLSWQAKLDGTSPFIVLGAKESYSVPEVHIGYLYGDLDFAVNTMNKHIRNTVITLPAARGLCGILAGGMGPERVMDMKALRHGVDTFAKLGGETMIVDAGWYCKPGDEVHEWHNHISDWTPDREKHPDNFKELADYIHKNGLLFGLWLDIESAGRKSKIYTEHPEFMLKTRFGEVTTVLDMTNPEAAAFAENELRRVFTEYKIDLFRLDNNNGFRSYLTDRKLFPECVYARYYNAVYSMYERLRHDFPDIVFENCAGGGGRTDLGLVKYFTHTWVTDWQKMPRAVAITNGMTMCLPPEYVDRLSAGMESHIKGSLQMIVRHTIFGKPTINIFNPVGTNYNEQQLEIVNHTLDIYRDYIKPYAGKDLFYHHTPFIYGEEVTGDCVMERSAPDKNSSVIGIFRLGTQPKDEYITVYPRGIAPEGEYEVYYDNAGARDTRSGFQLVNNGIRVRLENALTSEIVIITRKQER